MGLQEYKNTDGVKVKRYWLNSVINWITMLVVFILAYTGVTNLAPNSGIKDYFLENYLLFFLAMGAFSGISGSISEERTLGTIQQFFLSRQGIIGILFIRIVVDFVMNIVLMVLFGLFASVVVRQPFALSLQYFILPLLISLPSLMGFGFFFGGLALIFKQIGSIINLVQFALIYLLIVDTTAVPAFSFLPFASGVDYIQYSLAGIPASTNLLTIAAINSAVYLSLGIVLFVWLCNKAKRENLIEAY